MTGNGSSDRSPREDNPRDPDSGEAVNQAYSLPFASVGRQVIVYSRARIIGAPHITIGDRVIVDDFVLLSAKVDCQIGSFVHVSSGSTIVGSGELQIENFVNLSSGVRLFTSNDDYLGGGLGGPVVPNEYRNVTSAKVHIGRHVIVGANSVILPGVHIGEGAAVGALSLVKSDLEPWTIYAGSPARPIRTRERRRILRLEEKLWEEWNS